MYVQYLEEKEMKENRKLKMAVISTLMALTLGVTAGLAHDVEAAAQKKVGIVQLVEHAALDAANKGFVDGLAQRGFTEGKNIVYDRQNAQADQSNLQNIAHRFSSSKVDLICAIATPSAQAMANVTDTIPIVGTAITDYVSARLAKTNAAPGGNVTGTTDMNPIEAQVDMLAKFAPNLKTIGAIYCSSEVNSQVQIDIMKDYAARKGFKVVEATVSTVNDIQQAARSLVGKCQGVYVPTDNILASAMPTLVEITNEAKIPVVAGEGGMVEAGGTASLAIDYYTLGVQTGQMAADILQGKAKPATMAIQGQKDCAAIVNGKELEILGLKLPAEYAKAKVVGK